MATSATQSTRRDTRYQEPVVKIAFMKAYDALGTAAKEKALKVIVRAV
jgi:hypothetical protein